MRILRSLGTEDGSIEMIASNRDKNDNHTFSLTIVDDLTAHIYRVENLIFGLGLDFWQRSLNFVSFFGIRLTSIIICQISRNSVNKL